MTHHDHSTKKQIETATAHVTSEDRTPERMPELGSFYGMQQALRKPSQATMTLQTVLQLQRVIGNQAIQRLLRKTAIVSAIAPQSTTSNADPIQLSRSGVVIMDGNSFAVRDPDEGIIRVDAGNFRIAINTAIEYDVVKPNKFFTKAVVVSAGERPEATDIGGEMREQNEARTGIIKSKGYFDARKVDLIGRQNVSGARKHYRDPDAVARSDREVYGLLDASKIEVTKIENTSDTFKIGLGGINSVVGEIIYDNANKNSVRAIKVFHVGPSL